jgi:hypothetical protein
MIAPFAIDIPNELLVANNAKVEKAYNIAERSAGCPRLRHRPACRCFRSGTPDPRWFRLGRQRVLRGGSAVARTIWRPGIIRGLRRDRCGSTTTSGRTIA